MGINNNGELIFPYGKEDTDYNIDGNPSSGYVFNGATSTFWCRLRDLLPGEITSTFNSVDAECFSATNLINQFDNFQSCFPEEIWRLDIERKYERTFTGESIDNSKPKLDVQYLRDMMEGKKKYQRRQWVNDQTMYFGTKNLMNTVVGDNNRITFRCFTPTGEDVVVKPDYTLRITPYSDIYISVMFGNGSTQQVRAKAGKEYIIDCPLSSMDDTQVTIYGANRIQALNNLSACYIAANNFSMATKLRKLVLGNTTPGYNNSRLISLTLGNNALLETLDIRNCGSLTGSLNATQCNNLLELYAEGTKLTGVLFATNGKLKTAHLPDTINTLTMRNLNDLTDFQATLTQLESLTLQGGTLNSLDIVQKTIETLRVLYLYDIDWTVTDTTLLNRLLKLFFSLLSGHVYISGQIRQQELLKYAQSWNDLEVTYDSSQLVTQYLVTFVNANGEKLSEQWVDRGSTPYDPVESGEIPTPTIPSTAQYNYTYAGWDDLNSSVLAAKTITAIYNEVSRVYTVNWYEKRGAVPKSKKVKYGSEAIYDGELPEKTDEEDTYVYNVFKQWDKSTGYIIEDTDVYPVWERGELPPLSKDLKDMSVAEIDGIVKTNKVSQYFEMKDYIDIPVGTDFTFSNVQEKVLYEEKYLDGKTVIDTGITLFSDNSPSFTLAIDFEFGSDETNNTLISCFDEEGNEGFRLRYNSTPNIQWGDKNVSVGYGYRRGLCVLRHQKGSDQLFVYVFDAGNTSFTDSVLSYELVRTRKTSTKAHLMVGGISFSDGGFDYYGKGLIHWCKIWYEDLGDTNAKQLASWTHEIWRMEFCGASKYRLANNTSKRSNASFIMNHLLDKSHFMNPTNTNVGGWNESQMRSFLNDKVYNALPLKWKQLIKKVKINASAGDKSQEIVISEDYLYLPSEIEINGNKNSPYIDEGAIIPWFTTSLSRIKFKNKVIPDNASYITSSTDPSLLSTSNLKEGDIWINTNNSSIGYYYIPKEKAQLSYYNYNNNDNIKASDGGLWLRCYWWWLRSPDAGSSTGFRGVYGNGGTSLSGAGFANGVAVCFSI